MNTQKLVRSSLAVALTLTFTGVASARRPPALAAEQTRTHAVAATCPEGRNTGGYRDVLARTVIVASTGVAGALPAPRKSGDHLVLTCAGGEIHQGSGYRDFPARTQPESRELEMAAAPSSAEIL